MKIALILPLYRKRDDEFNRLEKVQQFELDDFLLLNEQDVSGYTHAFSCLGTTMKQAGSKENSMIPISPSMRILLNC